jgi:hypothetical protein
MSMRRGNHLREVAEVRPLSPVRVAWAQLLMSLNTKLLYSRLGGKPNSAYHHKVRALSQACLVDPSPPPARRHLSPSG